MSNRQYGSVWKDDAPGSGSGNGLRDRIYTIIFESDTPAGKFFDEALIFSIILSVIVVMLDSVSSVKASHGDLLYSLEWMFTILFTIEYFLRLISIGRPAKYATSFFGVVDLLAIVPTYLSLFLPGSQYLVVIRVLRLLRVFRILKLVNYLSEADMLIKALRASRQKITLFLFAVVNLVIILGSTMYVIEGAEHGFTSIPTSIYWAVITLTTVGYGDIVPQTPLGQGLASVIMIVGYGIIAVPTGIITAEIAYASKEKPTSRVCTECSAEGHDADAEFCKKCGVEL
ncbi:MAG: ion transporter [Methanosarcinaceae archaeon]|nr:ion transporter [Methanosarcinaceae archaeon]MDF1533376.1 ion transporter [Methanosarcinaceae archaeon]